MRSVILADNESVAISRGSRLLLRPIDPLPDEIDAHECPFGHPGEKLWCAEAWRSWDTNCNGAWLDEDDEHECNEHCRQAYVAYRATPRHGFRPIPDHAPITFLDDSTPLDRNPKLLGPWSPAEEMPAWASRRTIVVEAIRATPLHDVTGAQLIAEGLCIDFAARRLLWDETYGDGSFDMNPWVWAIMHKTAEWPKR